MVYPARAVVEAAAASQVVVVKVDGDEHRELVERFGVGGYPTMVLVGPDGREIRRAVGHQGVEAMRFMVVIGILNELDRFVAAGAAAGDTRTRQRCRRGRLR